MGVLALISPSPTQSPYSRWVYSTPQPAFKAIAEEKVTNIVQKCGLPGDDLIDLAVQIRIFRDTNKDHEDHYFNKTSIHRPYRDCALQNALAAMQRKENDVRNRNQKNAGSVPTSPYVTVIVRLVVVVVVVVVVIGIYIAYYLVFDALYP